MRLIKSEIANSCKFFNQKDLWQMWMKFCETGIQNENSKGYSSLNSTSCFASRAGDDLALLATAAAIPACDRGLCIHGESTPFLSCMNRYMNSDMNSMFLTASVAPQRGHHATGAAEEVDDDGRRAEGGELSFHGVTRATRWYL